MKTEFKKLFDAVDKMASTNARSASLFLNEGQIDPADEKLVVEWSGQSADNIRMILSVAYGKRQIQFDPFTGDQEFRSKIRFIPLLTHERPPVHYSIRETRYGDVILASTDKGICYLVFYGGDPQRVPGIIQEQFPGSEVLAGTDKFQEIAMAYLSGSKELTVDLHVKGTADQLQIWKALTCVPAGKLVSYGTLAKATGQMAQDIGIAMGDNRIAMLIPCHRVIKATGERGQYHWGAKRKQAMLLDEATI